MKKLIFIVCTLLIIGSTLSSCTSSRGCNGNWYNNRNVQVQPENTDIDATCYRIEIKENI